MVIPIHDRNPVRSFTWVTYGLIAANVVVFLAGPLAVVGTHTSQHQLDLQQAYLYRWGAIPKLLLNGDQNVITAPLTAVFVHAGWVHLLGNMLFLYIFGNNVEDRLGSLHFLAFYAVAGVATTYAFAVANPEQTGPLVGASGAIAAVLGAYAFMYPQAKVTLLVPFLWFLPLRVPAWLVLGFWFVLQLPRFQSLFGSAAQADVAYFAHVTGFVLGLLYAALIVGRGDRDGGGPDVLPPGSPGMPGTPPPVIPDYRSADPNDPYGTYHP